MGVSEKDSKDDEENEEEEKDSDDKEQGKDKKDKKDDKESVWGLKRQPVADKALERQSITTSLVQQGLCHRQRITSTATTETKPGDGAKSSTLW